MPELMYFVRTKSIIKGRRCLWRRILTGYFGVHEKLRTAQTDREGDALLDYLTNERFPDLDTLIAFCERNGSCSQGVWLYTECELCNYAIRIIPMKNNYNLYLYQYKR